MNLVDELIKKLNEDKWIFDNYTAMHKASNVEIWIANIPILNLYIYRPTKISFSLLNKWKLWRAIRACKKRLIIKQLEAEK